MLFTRYISYLLLVFFLVSVSLRASLFSKAYQLNPHEQQSTYVLGAAVGFTTQFIVALLADNTFGRFRTLFGLVAAAFVVEVLDVLRVLLPTGGDFFLKLVMLLNGCVYLNCSMFFVGFITDQLPRLARPDQRERVMAVVFSISYGAWTAAASILYMDSVRAFYDYVPAIAVLLLGAAGTILYSSRELQNPDSLKLERGLAWKAALVYYEAVRLTYQDIRKQKINVEEFDEQTLETKRKKSKKEARQDGQWEYTQTFMDRVISPQFNQAFVANIYHMQQLSFVCIRLIPCWIMLYSFANQRNHVDAIKLLGNVRIPREALTSMQYLMTTCVLLFMAFVFFPTLRRVFHYNAHGIKKLAFGNATGCLAYLGFLVLLHVASKTESLSLPPGVVETGFGLSGTNVPTTTFCAVRFKGEDHDIVVNLHREFLTGFRLKTGMYNISMHADSRNCALSPGVTTAMIPGNPHVYHCFMFFLQNNKTLSMKYTKFHRDSTTEIMLEACNSNMCVRKENTNHKLPMLLTPFKNISGDYEFQLEMSVCDDKKQNRLPLRYDDLHEIYGSKIAVIVASHKPCGSKLAPNDTFWYSTFERKSYLYVHELYKVPLVFLHSCTESFFWLYGSELMYGQAPPPLRLLSLSMLGFSGLGGAIISRLLDKFDVPEKTRAYILAVVLALSSFMLYKLDMDFDYVHIRNKRKIEALAHEEHDESSQPRVASAPATASTVRHRRTLDGLSRLLGGEKMGSTEFAPALAPPLQSVDLVDDPPPVPVILKG